jgi:hypothetical protein
MPTFFTQHPFFEVMVVAIQDRLTNLIYSHRLLVCQLTQGPAPPVKADHCIAASMSLKSSVYGTFTNKAQVIYNLIFLFAGKTNR